MRSRDNLYDLDVTINYYQCYSWQEKPYSITISSSGNPYFTDETGAKQWLKSRCLKIDCVIDGTIYASYEIDVEEYEYYEKVNTFRHGIIRVEMPRDSKKGYGKVIIKISSSYGDENKRIKHLLCGDCDYWLDPGKIISE